MDLQAANLWLAIITAVTFIVSAFASPHIFSVLLLAAQDSSCPWPDEDSMWAS